MKREDLDIAINAINKEQRELENKISALKAKKKELQLQYISDYTKQTLVKITNYKQVVVTITLLRTRTKRKHL